MTTTTPTPTARPRYDTIGATAVHFGVTPRTIRNWIGKGLIVAYRIPGTRGVRLNINEVDRAMRVIPAARVRQGVGSYGPNATIIDLPPQPVRAEVVFPEQPSDD